MTVYHVLRITVMRLTFEVSTTIETTTFCRSVLCMSEMRV